MELNIDQWRRPYLVFLHFGAEKWYR